MKHIITIMLLMAWSAIIAQNPAESQFLSLKIYWPDGSIYDGPGTYHIEGPNCIQGVHQDFQTAEGLYIIINPLICQSGNLRLTGDADPKAGVSVLDLIRVSKHLLGIDPFTSALQLLASDANNSESLSALDLIEIRKIILGLGTTWTNNTTLKFVVKETPNPPAIGSELKSSVFINSQTNVVEFWVVKTGDIR